MKSKLSSLTVIFRLALMLALCSLAVSCRAPTSPFPPGPGTFRGHVRMGWEISDFVPCNSSERWWVNAMDSRTREKLFSVNHFAGQTAYAEVKGMLSTPGEYGHLDAYRRMLVVQEVLILREPGPNDCKESPSIP